MANKRDLRLNVEVTRNYGLHSVKFGLSEVVTVEHGQARRDAFANLLVQLDDQIKLYEETMLQDTRLPMVMSSNTDSKVKTIPAVKLVVENKQGKREVSLQGGQYSKHGVPVYSDTCETELDIDNYEYGVHDLSHHNLTATIDIVDGKPKRVLVIK